MAGELRAAPTGAVAPIRHTYVLLAGLFVVSVAAAVRSPISQWPETLAQPYARVRLYLQILAFQGLWAGYVWFGIRYARGSIRDVIDGGAWSGRRWLRLGLVGVTGFLVWLALSGALGRVLQPSPDQMRGVQAMLPHTQIERELWVAFAVAAAFCEELVYRGYLVTQFRALTGSTVAAVVLQAAFYGAAHLALPLALVIPVGLLGLLLGALAVWQKSLVPGMILHALNGLIALLASGR